MNLTNKRLPAALIPLAAALMLGGCRNAMHEENVGLHDQNRDLQAALNRRGDELKSRPTEAELASLNDQVAQRDAAIAERDQLINDLRSKLNAPSAAGGPAIPGMSDVDVSYDPAKRELNMRVPGDVVFASGSTSINKGSEATLGRIADVIKKDYAAKQVRVEGHTDADPIKKTAKLYDDNRDLSIKRAYAVTKFLETKGVQPAHLATVGYGQYQPRGGNKKDNRRVEIVVLM